MIDKKTKASSKEDPSKNENGNINGGVHAATMNYTPYETWVRRLYATNLFHPVKMELQNIQQLYELLGSPMEKRTVIHIAGTNGKGSVAWKMARTLECQNPHLKVGLFCSPHVSTFRERMSVNQKLISEDQVVEYLPHIYQLCEQHDIPATFFEITTALAFHYFAQAGTDVVVLETGLGGRLDATNVIQQPAISIITSIGLEHTRILGDTIELIAKEKAGIMKAGQPVLVGPNVPHDVLRQCAEEKGASGYFTCDDVLGATTTNETDEEDYDRENARIATAALKLLEESHPELLGDNQKRFSDDAIQQGSATRPPCRFEYIESSSLCGNDKADGIMPPVILDVAHNPPAMEYMVRKLQTTYPETKVRVVVGMSSDKDLKLCSSTILKAVDGDASRIHLVEAAHPRAAKLEAILNATSSLDFSKAHYNLQDRTVSSAITQAIELAKKNNEMLVVCGSVFLMAEAREALGIDEPRDSSYIAELAGSGVRHSQENFGNSSFPTDNNK